MRTSQEPKLSHMLINEPILLSDECHVMHWLACVWIYEQFTLTKGGRFLSESSSPFLELGLGFISPEGLKLCPLINRGSPWLHMCAGHCCSSHSVFAITHVVELRSPVAQELAQVLPVSGEVRISRFSDSKVYPSSNTPPFLSEWTNKCMLEAGLSTLKG